MNSTDEQWDGVTKVVTGDGDSDEQDLNVDKAKAPPRSLTSGQCAGLEGANVSGESCREHTKPRERRVSDFLVYL